MPFDYPSVSCGTNYPYYHKFFYFYFCHGSFITLKFCAKIRVRVIFDTHDIIELSCFALDIIYFLVNFIVLVNACLFFSIEVGCCYL